MPIHHDGVRLLAAKWGKVPTELRKEMRPALRAGADEIVADMRSRASYSTRIPGAIRVGVSFGSRAGGVQIRVDHTKAPHARPLEGLGKGGTFRHPVFGNRNVWVAQATRPFFFPAVNAGRDQLQKHIADAVKASLPRGLS